METRRNGEAATPKDVEAVFVDVGNPALQDSDIVMWALAHELCHCVGVPHHGPRTIVNNELIEWQKQGCVVAFEHGAYSGPAECIMRYRQAHFYKDKGGFYHRWDNDTLVQSTELRRTAGHVHLETPTGLFRLCSAGDADSKAGPAFAGLGDCLHKLNVRDFPR